ncbi:unnamed protein product [Moneuplotes crassus]|uniref:Uncharacterized protein n=1 Tax=Euplotes crassus TaxID=5936 RepID=A0AAD1X1C7_EUPCR|nr:unnamed protein product [Moneuplotes crassus]
MSKDQENQPPKNEAEKHDEIAVPQESKNEVGQDDIDEPSKPNIQQDQEDKKNNENEIPVENDNKIKHDPPTYHYEKIPLKPKIAKEKSKPKGKGKPIIASSIYQAKNNPTLGRNKAKSKRSDINKSNKSNISKKKGSTASKASKTSKKSEAQKQPPTPSQDQQPGEMPQENHEEESERQEQLDEPKSQINEVMHSTFLNNNEQIIADLANLEIHQERQIFRIIFDTFKANPGVVEFDDLTVLGKALGKEKDEVDDLCHQIHDNFEGFLDFSQFCELLPNLDPSFKPKEPQEQLSEGGLEEEKKLEEVVVNKQNPDFENIENEGKQEINQDIPPQEIPQQPGSEIDKKAEAKIQNLQPTELGEYKDNAIVPSNGVALTPDSRVIKLIKQLNTYFRNCEKQKEFGEAKIVKKKLETLKKKELKRQKDYLRANQEKELISIENSQKIQFFEFSQAWDTFMADYESTAYLSLEKLKERHSKEMAELQKDLADKLNKNLKFSKKVYDLRRRVEALINMRNYEEADKYKMFLIKLENEERVKKSKELRKDTLKKEKKLKNLHQQQMAALLKRIQRDRNEQLKHRQKDSQKLIQRNRNILVDLLNKQSTEARRTSQFVQYTLGSTDEGPKKYYQAKIHYAPFVHKYKHCQTLNASKGAKKASKTTTNWNKTPKAKDTLEEPGSISGTDPEAEGDEEAIKLPLLK